MLINYLIGRNKLIKISTLFWNNFFYCYRFLWIILVCANVSGPNVHTISGIWYIHQIRDRVLIFQSIQCYIQGNSKFMLQLFYHINIQNREKCIIFHLEIYKMICKFYIFLQCMVLGLNFRNSNGNLYLFRKHNVQNFFLMHFIAIEQQ